MVVSGAGTGAAVVGGSVCSVGVVIVTTIFKMSPQVDTASCFKGALAVES